MNHGTPDRRWRRAERPAKERAERCCAAMTLDENVAVALGNFEAVAHLGIGARASAEVVQLHVAASAAAQQPPKQFKGFAKVHLEPGATTEVCLRMDRDELAAFDEASGTWIVHEGRYKVLVGWSSRDIRGRAGFEVGARTPVGS
jgi:hypothetical protein